MKKSKYENLLTSHEIEFLKKIDEYDKIKAGLDFMELVDKLPKDFNAFFDKLNKEVPKNSQKTTVWLKSLAQTDPKFFEEVVAVMLVLNDMEEPSKKVEKLSKKQLEQEEFNEAIDIMYKKIKSML